MSDGRPQTESSETADSNTAGRPAEPPTVTYRCRPDGFTCGQCGDKTDTQWVKDGVFVCPDCKSWA